MNFSHNIEKNNWFKSHIIKELCVCVCVSRAFKKWWSPNDKGRLKFYAVLRYVAMPGSIVLGGGESQLSVVLKNFQFEQ